MPIQRAKPRLVDLDQTPLTSVATSNLPSGTFKRMFHGNNTSHVYMPSANTWYDLCTASSVVVDQNDIVLATYSVTSRVQTANGHHIGFRYQVTKADSSVVNIGHDGWGLGIHDGSQYWLNNGVMLNLSSADSNPWDSSSLHGTLTVKLQARSNNSNNITCGGEHNSDAGYAHISFSLFTAVP